MKSLLYILRKSLSLICWLGAGLSFYRLLGSPAQLVPYSLFSTILWFYWGCILWENNRRMVAINGFAYTLLVIIIFIAEVFACGLIGVLVAGLFFNFNQTVVGWIYAILMTICLFRFAPSRILPKRFFVEEPVVTPSEPDSDKNTDKTNETSN